MTNTDTKFRYAPVGSRVRSGYWGDIFTVLSHNDNGTVTVRWETGRNEGEVVTHLTPFDHGPRGDKILDDPAEHDIALALLRHELGAQPLEDDEEVYCRQRLAAAHRESGDLHDEARELRALVKVLLKRWPEVAA